MILPYHSFLLYILVKSFSEKKESPVVLLSPAAASFDQFESYEARGEQFKSIVGSLNLEKFSNWETTT